MAVSMSTDVNTMLYSTYKREVNLLYSHKQVKQVTVHQVNIFKLKELIANLKRHLYTFILLREKHVPSDMKLSLLDTLHGYHYSHCLFLRSYFSLYPHFNVQSQLLFSYCGHCLFMLFVGLFLSCLVSVCCERVVTFFIQATTTTQFTIPTDIVPHIKRVLDGRLSTYTRKPLCDELSTFTTIERVCFQHYTVFIECTDEKKYFFINLPSCFTLGCSCNKAHYFPDNLIKTRTPQEQNMSR